jgi:hypothetical protein
VELASPASSSVYSEVNTTDRTNYSVASYQAYEGVWGPKHQSRANLKKKLRQRVTGVERGKWRRQRSTYGWRATEEDGGAIEGIPTLPVDEHEGRSKNLRLKRILANNMPESSYESSLGNGWRTHGRPRRKRESARSGPRRTADASGSSRGKEASRPS